MKKRYGCNECCCNLPWLNELAKGTNRLPCNEYSCLIEKEQEQIEAMAAEARRRGVDPDL